MSIVSERLGWLIKRVQYGHHRALNTRLASLGVSLVQWNALREIERHPGRSQHHLAEQTFNSDQAFGALLNRLQVAGLIERRSGSGKAISQALTPKGAHLLHKGHGIMSEVTEHSFAPLTDQERAELASLLAKVLDRPDLEPTLD